MMDNVQLYDESLIQDYKTLDDIIEDLKTGFEKVK